MNFEEDTYSSIFSALKHPVRRKILRMLDEAPAKYTQILERLGVETGFLNYHLGNLGLLITKNKDEKYSLSDFGRAALALLSGVEAPVQRRPRELRILGFKFSAASVSLFVLAALLLSNVYWVYAYQGLYRDRTNALGEVLIQTKGFLGESIHVLNLTIEERQIDFELWDILLRDLIQLSQQYKLVISLDITHGQQWLQIKAATDSLVDFVNDLTQIYAGNSTHMNITDGQLSYLGNINNLLLNIQSKAFPAKIVLGSDPKVIIGDSDITEAMENSIRLQTELMLARQAFNILKNPAS